MLFPACTEEVYLGPPLCYSVGAPSPGPSYPLHPYTSVTRRSSSSSSPEAPGPTLALRFPAPPAERGPRRPRDHAPPAPPRTTLRVSGGAEEEEEEEEEEAWGGEEPPYLNPWRPAARSGPWSGPWSGPRTDGVMTAISGPASPPSNPHIRELRRGGDGPREEEPSQPPPRGTAPQVSAAVALSLSRSLALSLSPSQ